MKRVLSLSLGYSKVSLHWTSPSKRMSNYNSCVSNVPVNSKFSQLQYLCPRRSLRHAIYIQTIPHPQQLYSTTTVIKENLAIPVIPDIHSVPQQDDPGIPRGGHALHSTFLCCRPASDSNVALVFQWRQPVKSFKSNKANKFVSPQWNIAVIEYHCR